MIDAYVLPDGLVPAYDTLIAGCRFLGSGRAGTDLHMADERLRARLIGNGLRELDRFLNLLIGEVMTALAMPMPADERNSANRLRRLRAGLGLADPDHARLQAIGRSRACLFHCWGLVRRADRHGASEMTSGWWDHAGAARRLRVVPIGARLQVSASDLTELCGFYAMLGETLLGYATDRATDRAMNRPVARAA